MSPQVLQSMGRCKAWGVAKHGCSSAIFSSLRQQSSCRESIFHKTEAHHAIFVNRLDFAEGLAYFAEHMSGRIYAGQVPSLADELVHTLTRDGDIEIEHHAEVRLDFEAVLKEYLRLERNVQNKTRQRAQQIGGGSNTGRIRAAVAQEMGAPEPDDVLPYLVAQMLEMLFHSENVQEVFADDATLRRKITPIIRNFMQSDQAIDQEVRGKLKNLQEGTAAFEVEYERIRAQVKRVRGLE